MGIETRIIIGGRQGVGREGDEEEEGGRGRRKGERAGANEEG